jgi:hypothetical protein
MTLAAIRSLRMRGERPGFVEIIVGPCPDWFPDGETVVKVPANANPARMDWRPLVGLPVFLIETADLPHLVSDVLSETERHGVKFLGAALTTGIYPCSDSFNDEFSASLRRTKELLCL